jgi:hypothetical protein
MNVPAGQRGSPQIGGYPPNGLPQIWGYPQDRGDGYPQIWGTNKTKGNNTNNYSSLRIANCTGRFAPRLPRTCSADAPHVLALVHRKITYRRGPLQLSLISNHLTAREAKPQVSPTTGFQGSAASPQVNPTFATAHHRLTRSNATAAGVVDAASAARAYGDSLDSGAMDGSAPMKASG